MEEIHSSKASPQSDVEEAEIATDVNDQEEVAETEEANETTNSPKATQSTTKIRATQPKLDYAFFRNTAAASPFGSQIDQAENVEVSSTEDDKLWNFFLDVPALWPTVEERMATSGQTNRQEAERENLDLLLTEIRRWIHVVYPQGMSLREFGEKVEAVSAKSADFANYRMELLYKYKHTNFQFEALKRKLAREELQQQKLDQSTAPNNSRPHPASSQSQSEPDDYNFWMPPSESADANDREPFSADRRRSTPAPSVTEEERTRIRLKKEALLKKLQDKRSSITASQGIAAASGQINQTEGETEASKPLDVEASKTPQLSVDQREAIRQRRAALAARLQQKFS